MTKTLKARPSKLHARPKLRRDRQASANGTGHAPDGTYERAYVLPSGITVAEVDLTPELAAEWLKKNHPANRKWSESRSIRYSGDMKDDLWELTHQGAAFDEHDHLIDARHRAEAVVLSGKTIRILVFRNVPVTAMRAVDRQMARSVADGATIAGIPMSKDQVAVGNAMVEFVSADKNERKRRASDIAIMNFVDRHREAIDFALSTNIGHACVRPTVIRGVMARAFYSRDPVRIREFGAVLRDGFYEDRERDAMAVKLRTWLTSDTQWSASRSTRREIYRKVERCLDLFLKGEQMERIYEAQEEMFLLPDEKAAIQAAAEAQKAADDAAAAAPAA